MSRKLLLASAALSSLAATAACSKNETAPPGNPKGSIYDQPPVVPDAGPVALPGNPKGSHYDTAPEDTKPPVQVMADAGGSKADAGTKPLAK